MSSLLGCQAVFGPAADGGYYLLGLRGPEVPAALFQVGKPLHT